MEDLTGRKFGKLTVIKRGENTIGKRVDGLKSLFAEKRKG